MVTYWSFNNKSNTFFSSYLFIRLRRCCGTITFIASSFPTSRNTSTIAMEYQIEPELHAQIVLFSTLFSIFTVTTVIFLSRILF